MYPIYGDNAISYVQKENVSYMLCVMKEADPCLEIIKLLA